MDDCKGVCYELATQDSSERLAHDIGRAFLGLLGWAQAALVFACIALAFGSQAPKAYALSARSSPEMVIDGNMVGDDAGSKGYMCAYCTPYTATLELIGHFADLPQIDQEKYNLLVGGNNPFTSAMSRWQELTGASNEEPVNTWLGDDGFIDGWLILAGKGRCWYGTFTDQQIRMAEIAFNSIMGGGSGGSTSPEVGYERFSYGEYSGGAATFYTLDGERSLSIDLPDVHIDSGERFVGVLRFRVGSDSTFQDIEVRYYSVPASTGLYYRSGNYKTLYWYNASGASVGYGSYRLNRRRESTSVPWSAWTVVDSTTFTRMSPISGMHELLRAEIDSNVSLYGCDSSDIPMPTPPDTDKPTTDAPTPPRLPDPKDPIVPRQPTKPGPPTIEPHIDLPDIRVVTQPTNTTPADYTPWLRAIFEELKAIHEDLGDWLQDIVDEMTNHCQHLRDEMSVQATYLGECLESVQDEVQNAAISISNSLGDYSEWLADYLDQWGEWLVEHLDFNNNVTVDPYDDTSLLYWIKRIYTKLGGSDNPVNSRPTDPVTNPVETGNWLEELWNEILKNLAQLFPNLMIDLGLIFDDLKSKFPFSIPWDIHALLLLLVTEPVAPHFTIPMYALSTSYELEVVGQYDIDLSFYTDYLMGVHLMLEIAWIGYMLKHTKDYMELIEAVIPS